MNDGPAAPEFPIFASTNDAATFDGRSWITFDDPGDASLFDYSSNDAIAIEAWVRIAAIDEGQQVYVIGKGRTGIRTRRKRIKAGLFDCEASQAPRGPAFCFDRQTARKKQRSLTTNLS